VPQQAQAICYCFVIPAKAGTHWATGAMFYVYMLASKPYGTLYVGVTSDLVGRVSQHRSKAVPGYTALYGVDRLVWFEGHDAVDEAIRREKRIKEWKRDWKINLIERNNPHWIDLYPTLSF
jgi:putative endonuclease